MAGSPTALVTARSYSSAAWSTRALRHRVANSLGERNDELPSEHRIEFGVGIHLGDVVEEIDGTLLGDGVNIAARPEGICEPGGSAYPSRPTGKSRGGSIVPSSIAVRLSSKILPNRSWSIRSMPRGSSRRSPRRPTTGKSAPPRLSIVVLPFADIGGDLSRSILVDGVTGEPHNRPLADARRLRSRPHTAFTYKDKPLNMTTIGREFCSPVGDRAKIVLDGSVWQERVREDTS